MKKPDVVKTVTVNTITFIYAEPVKTEGNRPSVKTDTDTVILYGDLREDVKALRATQAANGVVRRYNSQNKTRRRLIAIDRIETQTLRFECSYEELLKRMSDKITPV